jgi:hypothetical protein
VVPVASKNTKNGEIPDVRTVLTLSVSGPLVTGQATPLTEGVTETVTLCAVVPPAPVQVRV